MSILHFKYQASLGERGRRDLHKRGCKAALGLQGPVRRIHFAPPAAEGLVRGSGNPSSSGNARVSVLFASGTFGIWELDSRNELQQVLPLGASPAHQAMMSLSPLTGFLLLILTF